MRAFRLLTGSAFIAGLCLAPLGAEDAGTPATTTTPPTHHDGDHDGPRLRACENDKDRDQLRAELKRLSEKDRREFIEKLRHFMEERRQRLDHLCDLIRNHPHLSEARKKELLDIINEKREQIRDRMKEFIGDEKEWADKQGDKIELRKLSDRIDDLRDFIKSHPCLNDDQKCRIQAKIADLKDDRKDVNQDLKNDRAADHKDDKVKSDGNGDGNGSAISDAQADDLKARMIALRAAHQDAAADHKDIVSDHKDIAADRKDIAADHQDIKQDQQKLQSDKSAGDAAAAKADHKDIAADRKDIAKDDHDVRKDVRDIDSDVADLRRDQEHPFLNAEQRDKMRARIAAWRAGHKDADGDGHPGLTDDQKDKIRDHLAAARDAHHDDVQGDRKDLAADRKDLHADRTDGDKTDAHATLKDMAADRRDLHTDDHGWFGRSLDIHRDNDGPRGDGRGDGAHQDGPRGDGDAHPGVHGGK